MPRNSSPLPPRLSNPQSVVASCAVGTVTVLRNVPIPRPSTPSTPAPPPPPPPHENLQSRHVSSLGSGIQRVHLPVARPAPISTEVGRRWPGSCSGCLCKHSAADAGCRAKPFALTPPQTLSALPDDASLACQFELTCWTERGPIDSRLAAAVKLACQHCEARDARGKQNLYGESAAWCEGIVAPNHRGQLYRSLNCSTRTITFCDLQLQSKNWNECLETANHVREGYRQKPYAHSDP